MRKYFMTRQRRPANGGYKSVVGGGASRSVFGGNHSNSFAWTPNEIGSSRSRLISRKEEILFHSGAGYNSASHCIIDVFRRIRGSYTGEGFITNRLSGNLTISSGNLVQTVFLSNPNTTFP